MKLTLFQGCIRALHYSQVENIFQVLDELNISNIYHSLFCSNYDENCTDVIQRESIMVVVLSDKHV